MLGHSVLSCTCTLMTKKPWDVLGSTHPKLRRFRLKTTCGQDKKALQWQRRSWQWGIFEWSFSVYLLNCTKSITTRDEAQTVSIKKGWGKAAAVQACRIAPALGCPSSQRFDEQNPREPRWEKTSGQDDDRAKLSQASSRNTKPSKTPSMEVAPMPKGWAGNRGGRDAVPSPNIPLGNAWDKKSSWKENSRYSKGLRQFFFWKIAKTWNISFHQDIKKWMIKSMSLLHSIYTRPPSKAA